METFDIDNRLIKELDSFEVKTIGGGQMIDAALILNVCKGILKRGIALIVGGLIFELITEGIEQCIEDFEEGYNSTYKGN
jgi:hypothetical protein